MTDLSALIVVDRVPDLTSEGFEFSVETYTQHRSASEKINRLLNQGKRDHVINPGNRFNSR